MRTLEKMVNVRSMSPPVSLVLSEADPVVRAGGNLVRGAGEGLWLLKYVVFSRVVLFFCSFVVVTITNDVVNLYGASLVLGVGKGFILEEEAESM